ncbi:hypothetical protein HPB49_018005 [Dermacentor silvarum]|uniref:Uncharacterized protein n=1 Tax=Dermacentor silvarum TaxID=543639 RepID=A0ACB8DEV3_DERSI|nr:hypothetical protein HPB49_018005 [Dermacentor silvarum]
MFFKYYRMSPDKFDFLYRLVMNDLIRQFLCREPLCPEERLAITIRRIVKNAFVILVARWRVLLGRLNLLPSNATHVVLACCALHNFLCSTSKATYSPPGYVDGEDCYGNVNPGQWRKEAQVNELCDLEGTSSRNYTVDAAQTRNLFAKYFMAEGAVPWQWAHTYLPTPCNA